MVTHFAGSPPFGITKFPGGKYHQPVLHRPIDADEIKAPQAISLAGALFSNHLRTEMGPTIRRTAIVLRFNG